MLWEPTMRVEEAAGSRSHLIPRNSNHSKSPAAMAAVSSPLGRWGEGVGRGWSVLVRVG